MDEIREEYEAVVRKLTEENDFLRKENERRTYHLEHVRTFAAWNPSAVHQASDVTPVPLQSPRTPSLCYSCHKPNHFREIVRNLVVPSISNNKGAESVRLRR